MELLDTTGRWHLLWDSTGGSAGGSARVFSVKNGIVTYRANECGSRWIRTPLVVGTDRRSEHHRQPQFALASNSRAVRHSSPVGKRSQTSSQYRSGRWTPEHMTGVPDVYPKYGDYDDLDRRYSDGGENGLSSSTTRRVCAAH